MCVEHTLQAVSTVSRALKTAQNGDYARISTGGTVILAAFTHSFYEWP